MSNLPPNPYDRTVIVEPNVDNPDRADTVGSGRAFTALLSDAPGASQQFLARNGQWFTFGTTELTSWGNIMGDITNQADLMAMFALYTPTTGYAPVAFSGDYNALINKPPLGTVSPIDLNGLTSMFLRGDGQWAIPVDVQAQWGNISGNIFAQTDLINQLSLKAPLNAPTFTGAVNIPTPPVSDASTLAINSLWYAGQAYNGLPVMDGVASSGSGTTWAHGNHRHPTDTTLAPLDSPTLVGIPTAPTPAYPNNSQRIATTAYVTAAIAASGGVSPPPSDGNIYGYQNGAWVVLSFATKWDRT